MLIGFLLRNEERARLSSANVSSHVVRKEVPCEAFPKDNFCVCIISIIKLMHNEEEMVRFKQFVKILISEIPKWREDQNLRQKI